MGTILYLKRDKMFFKGNQLVFWKKKCLLSEIAGATGWKLNTFRFLREPAAGKLVIATKTVTPCPLAMKKVPQVDSFTKSEDLNAELTTKRFLEMILISNDFCD